MSDKDKDITFEFRIKYKTRDGQNIYIFGDNDDFGNWKNKKFKLDWSDGHIWKKDYKIQINNNKLIKYKFVVFDNFSDEVIWEKGPNRILDPNNISGLKIENNKFILDLHWERFSIIFNLYYYQELKDSYMVILGNKNFLGDWKIDRHQDYNMKLEKDNQDKDVLRKEIIVTLDDNYKHMEALDCEYKYLIYNYKNNTHTFEKSDICRHFKILFDLDKISDELKFLYLSNKKEYKLLTNSCIEINDENFIDD